MTIAWFICGYKTRTGFPNRRYCAMNDFTAQIEADAGEWSEGEVLGGSALVKVRANDATLTTIANAAGFLRLPSIALDTTLGSLSTGQRNTILTRIQAMGYTSAELDAIMGTTLTQWRNKTFRQLLNFICQRRLTPRWDETLQQIVLDGSAVSCDSPASIDGRVV